MNFFTLIILLSSIKLASLSWVLFYSEFQDPLQSYNIVSWNKNVVRQCGVSLASNGIDVFSTNQFGALGNSPAGSTTYRTIQQFPPHFQIEADVDILVLGTMWTGENVNIYLGPDTLFLFPYSSTSNIANICPSATNTAGYGFMSTVYKSHSIQGDLSLNIADYYAPAHDLSVKNFYIYLNMCDYTCATCSSDTNTSCLTCPTGALQSGSSCQCNASLYAYQGVCRTTCPAQNIANATNRICVLTPNWLIVYNNFLYNGFQNINVDWTFTPSIVNFVTTCGSITLVGGYNLFQTMSMTKTFTGLPPHFKLRLGANVYLVDGFTAGQNVIMSVDGSTSTIAWSTTSTTISNLGNICGNSSNSNPEYQQYVELVVAHTASSVTVTFYSTTITSASTTFWGIREIFVDVQSCYVNCATCSSTTVCTACNAGYFLLNNQCYDRCPLYTTQVGSTCVEQYLSLFTNGLYILQSLWWTHFSHSDITNWGYTFSNFFATRRYNLCRGRNIIGGWGVGSPQAANTPMVIENSIATVNPHWQVRLIAELYLIDNWGAADTVSIVIDNSSSPLLTVTKTSGNSPNNVCGNYSQNDQYQVVNQVFPHSNTSFDVKFVYTTTATLLATTASFGLGEVDIIIDQCPIGCLTCNSATACQSCIAGYYFLSDAQACYADCTTITGKPNFINQVATPTSVALCVCNTGYYYSSATITCSACSYQCTQCTGPLVTDCTVCASIRQTTGVCSCPSIYFDIPGNPVCQACNANCATCATTATNCLTCAGNKKVISGVCTCDQGTYDQGVGYFCANCSYTCLNCVTSSTNCTSCPANSNRVTPVVGNTSCPCQSGYYDNGTAICQPCSAQCATCTGSASNCLTCNSANFFTMVSSQCVCMTGYYLDANGVCQPCQQYCTQCSGPGPNGCNLCQSPRTGSGCLCTSNQYTVANDVNCYNCAYFCNGCSITASNCNVCAENRNQDAVCSCPSGYYDSGIAQCQQCQFPCANCSSSTTCTTCVGLYRSGSSCACNAGYYDTGVNNCQLCNPKCATCSGSSDNCLTCATGRVTSNCVCPTGYWDNGVSAQCLSCYVSCATCTGGASNQCLSCNLGFVFDSSTNTCNCPNGQYLSTSATCQNCNYTCSQCTNGTSTGCTSCAANRTLTSSGTCPCITNFTDNGTACIQTTFPVTTPPHCSVCVVSNICQTCKATFELDVGKCVCPRGTYLSSTSDSCSSCSSSCATCSSATVCLDCADGYYLNSVSQMCEGSVTQDSSHEVEIILTAVFLGIFLTLAVPYYHSKGIKKVEQEYKELNENNQKQEGAESPDKEERQTRRDSQLLQVENI